MPKTTAQKLLLLKLAKKTYASKQIVNTYTNQISTNVGQIEQMPRCDNFDIANDEVNTNMQLLEPHRIIILLIGDSDSTPSLSHIADSAIRHGFRVKYFNYYGISVYSWNKYKLYDWVKRYSDNENILVLSEILNNHFRFKHNHTMGLLPRSCVCGYMPMSCMCEPRAGGLCGSGTDIDDVASGKNNYYPTQIAKIYDFPAPTNAPLCIGVIGLSGVVDVTNIQQYWLLNCKIPHANLPKIVIISTDGTSISPANVGYEQENTVDVELIGGCCASLNSNVVSNVTIVVYHAENTIQGFYTAFQYAINDNVYKPSVISCSWGTPEINYTNYGASGLQIIRAFSTLFATAVQKGINICCATGDNAASDGVNDGKPHIDFPASSPNVVACGGTTLICPDSIYSSQSTNETVWSFNVLNNDGTGGGMSDVFQKPDYQTGIVQPTFINRCVPDIVANADPSTGFYIKYNDNMYIIGGTSCAAPVVASFIALSRVNKFINPIIYKNPNAFHKISVGTNGTYSANPLQQYTPCTGLGSINGKVLLPLLK